MDLVIGPLLRDVKARQEEQAMMRREKWVAAATISGAVLVAAYGALSKVSAGTSQAKHDHSGVVFLHPLPQLDGGHLAATLVEVNYAPGESSPPHTHPCPVICYILEGTYRTQVKGEPEAIYKAGESFYEAPNGVHAVSANASQSAPLRFIAFFTCDRQAPLSTAVSEKSSGGTQR